MSEHKTLKGHNLSSVYISCFCFLSMPQNILQLPFVETVLKVIAVNVTIVLFVPMFNFLTNVCNKYSVPSFPQKYKNHVTVFF